MKKIITIIAGIAITLSANAQVIPNGDFENWTQTGSGFSLNNWQIFTAGVTRIASPISGSYMLQIGTAGLPTQLGTAFASTNRPTSIRFVSGFAKQLSTDFAVILVTMTKWNSTTSTRDTILSNPIIINVNTATGSSVALADQSINLTYRTNTTDNPDSARITIINALPSSGSSVGQNTTLIIDNIRFSEWGTSVQPVPVGTIDIGSVKVFPNPAKSIVNFTTENVLARTIAIYDITGRLIENINLQNKEAKLNVEDYSNGIYIYSICNENGQAVSSGKFSVSK
ncbi:MAG: T9SS type A sorting domain-containing protein [Bacteroidota bacterium]